MDYRQDGQYYAQQAQQPQQQQQQQIFPAPGSPQGPVYAQPQAYPQVVIPSSPIHYPQLQQQQQPHPQLQSFPGGLPHSGTLPPQIPPQYPAPPHASFHYGGISAAPGPPYTAVPNPDAFQQPSPLLYSNQLPHHASQSPVQPSPYPQPSPSHPSIQIHPPPRPSSSHKSPVRDTQQPKQMAKAKTKPQNTRVSMSSGPVQKQQASSKASPVDYQVLLLSLADEYLDAAHSQVTTLAISRQQEGLDQYYKLVATGLGCLEAVLNNWRLPPQIEALVRLRYARILYEETTNDLEAETALTKGIDVCERNRMFDLKYSMQQLLSRIMFRSNPKAAIKAVDVYIQDIEAYRQIGWEYSFRLLRVTLSLSPSQHQDLVGALHNLQKISSLANRSGDKAVVAISSILEALAHLQQSSSTDSIEQAQRAIATARGHQLDPDVRDNPQLNTIIQMIDIFCSVLEYDVGQSSQKLQSMQKSMDQNIHDPHWKDDGTFTISLNPRTVDPSSIESGDILQVENGAVMLAMNWLPQHDLYALCYFLSSVTLSAKNSQDGHKAEKYLQEGLRMVKTSLEGSQEISESLTFSTSRLQWRRVLYCNMLLQRLFLLCSRTEWRTAKTVLKEICRVLSELDDPASSAIQSLTEYASGLIAQSNGDLQNALETFEQPIFDLTNYPNKISRHDILRDTAILANLNLVLILRDPVQADRSAATHTLSEVEPYCQNNPSKYIQAAYSLISATIHTASTIQTKHDLHKALQSATAISNSQVTCMALTFMSWKYFRGVIGEQSEKSAMAARAMARKADNKLWISVTEELLAETLDRQGKSGEALTLRGKAGKELSELPPCLKKTSSNGTGMGETKMRAVEI